MSCSISYHGVDHSQALDLFIKDHVEKIEEKVNGRVKLEWVVGMEKDVYIVSLNLWAKQNFIRLSQKSHEVHKAIAKASEMAQRELRKMKNKKIKQLVRTHAL
ncbi:MAG: hypothetical protein HOE90_14020 [Bacteriovoracaceae bacterium]|jgi:ribosome-associated translation inhibitor RaiA|nr:hypothetical protein [Bacteriovoracaceae bacterium]